MSPRFVLGRENVPCVAEVVNRSLKADCTDFTLGALAAVLYCLPYLELYRHVVGHMNATTNSFSFLLRFTCLWSTLPVKCLTKPMHLDQFLFFLRETDKQ